jgi:hypothetical protein
MLNANNLKIAALASKEQSRYSISTILIEPGRTAVTDGHLAATVTTPSIPAADQPAIPGFTASEITTSFMISAKDALDVAKALPSKSVIPILLNAFVDAAPAETARIAVTDLDTARIFDCKKAAGQFPNIDQVIPKDDDAEIAIALNPDYLGDLLRALTPITKKDAHACILRIKDPETQIRIDFENADTGQKGIGVLMPMQDKTKCFVRPRPVTVELLDGRVRNVWCDGGVELQFVNQKHTTKTGAASIAGAQLWKKGDFSPTREIPSDFLEYLAAKAQAETAAAESVPPADQAAAEPAPEALAAAIAVVATQAAAAESIAEIAAEPAPEPEPAGKPGKTPKLGKTPKTPKARKAAKVPQEPAAPQTVPVAIEVATPEPSASPKARKARKVVPLASPSAIAEPVIPPANPVPTTAPAPASSIQLSSAAIANRAAGIAAYWAAKRAAKIA